MACLKFFRRIALEMIRRCFATAVTAVTPASKANDFRCHCYSYGCLDGGPPRQKRENMFVYVIVRSRKGG